MVTEMQRGSVPLKNFQETWNGSEVWISFEVEGFEVSGHIVILVNRVDIDGDVPWIARGRFEAMVRDSVTKSLRLKKAHTVNVPKPKEAVPTSNPQPLAPAEPKTASPAKPRPPAPLTQPEGVNRARVNTSTPTYLPAPPLEENLLEVLNPLRFVEDVWDAFFGEWTEKN